MGDKGNLNDDMDIIDDPDPNAGKVSTPTTSMKPRKAILMSLTWTTT